MTTATLSSRIPPHGDRLRLSDGRCVRWFVEALQLFRRFDETGATEPLTSAKGLLEKCILTAPQDVLPRFYLAVAESVLGDMDQAAAIKIFEDIAQDGSFEVRMAAQYNLAAAYIETYDGANLRKAQLVLDGLISELQDKGAPIGLWDWFFAIWSLFSKRRTRVEQLYYQTREAQTYLAIHLDLWKPRWEGIAASDVQRKAYDSEADRLFTELAKREKGLARHARLLGSAASEIWAWHWNNIGMLCEARAARARTMPEVAANAVDDYAAKSKAAYLEALDADLQFGSARANLGRLYLEILADNDGAIAIFEQTLRSGEDLDYTHYNLGLAFTLKNDEMEAVSHFKQAPDMMKVRKSPATWLGGRKVAADQLLKWGRYAEAKIILDALILEHPRDAGVKALVDHLKIAMSPTP